MPWSRPQAMTPRQLAARLFKACSSPGGDDPTHWVGSWLAAHERELWFVALSAMVFDVILTVHGLQLGLSERNPVARAALESTGTIGLYLVKSGAVLTGLCCRPFLPESCTVIIPLALAIPSVLAVGVNTALIVSAVH